MINVYHKTTLKTTGVGGRTHEWMRHIDLNPPEENHGGYRVQVDDLLQEFLQE